MQLRPWALLFILLQVRCIVAQTPIISTGVQQAQLAIQLNYTRWSGFFSSQVSLSAGLAHTPALHSCTQQTGAVANVLSCAGQVVLDTSQVQWVLQQDINVTVGPVSNATVDRRGDMTRLLYTSAKMTKFDWRSETSSAELQHLPAQPNLLCNRAMTSDTSHRSDMSLKLPAMQCLPLQGRPPTPMPMRVWFQGIAALPAALTAWRRIPPPLCRTMPQSTPATPLRSAVGLASVHLCSLIALEPLAALHAECCCVKL